MMRIRGRDLMLLLTEMTARKLAMVTMSRFSFLSLSLSLSLKKKRVGSIPTLLLSVADVIQLYYS